jgi:hypothetical protein
LAQSQTRNSGTSGGGADEDSSLALLTLPIIGAIFGSNSTYLGQLGDCLYEAVLRGSSCDQRFSSQDGMITVAIGFLVTCVLGAWLAKTDKDAGAVVATAITTIVSAPFAVIQIVVP